eukprot:7243160-Lingulodinium_polyedra.AAC.1
MRHAARGANPVRGAMQDSRSGTGRAAGSLGSSAKPARSSSPHGSSECEACALDTLSAEVARAAAA